MSQSAITISPQEMAAIRELVARLGRHGEPSSVEGLRLIGRASDVVPGVVHASDDVLFFMSLQGALVIGAVRDDGGVTYARMDNFNNIRVVGFNDVIIVNTLVNILASILDNVTATEAVRAELSKLTIGGISVRSILLEPARQSAVEGQAVTLVSSRQGHLFSHDLGLLPAGVLRKYVGVDAGAYVSPVGAAGPTDTTSAVTFTGVLLVGRVRRLYNVTDDMFHTITTIVDPAGGVVGTLTVTPAIPSASAVLRIPYAATPFAWNSATDATQTLAVAGDPPRINGPATFLSVGAAVIGNGTTQYVLPCANYARYSISIVWTSAVTTTLQFRSYGKHDDALWAVAGAIPATYCIDSLWQYSDTGAQFGVAPALTGVLVANMIEPHGYNSIAIEMIAAASGDNTPTTGTLTLFGGTK